MLVDILGSRHYRRLPYLIVPTAFLSSWLVFGYFTTGDALVSWTDQKYWQQGGVGDGIKIAQAILQHGLRGLVNCCYGLDPTIFWALGIFAVLIVMTWKVDPLLWAYSIGLAGLLLITATYDLSLLRFFAFIFPIWLTIRVKNPVIAAIGVGMLIPMTIVLWLYTISITFVG
jgi:hypothetical protein